MMISLIWLFSASFIAFSISAICGGGAGLMLIPALGLYLPVSNVPAALSIGTFSSSSSRLVVFRKNISWSIVKIFVPFALPAAWLGAWMLKFLDPLYLELAIGFFLLSNVVFLFRKSPTSDTAPKRNPIVLALIGMMAGFLSGLTGAVGLIFNRFYLRYGLSKEEIMATRAANEIILHLLKIILYSLFGLLNPRVLLFGVAVALAAVLSSWTMKRILPFISDKLFRRIGYMAMVFSGMVMLSQSFTGLMKANGGDIDARLIDHGLESKLKWQNANFAVEFNYDEGFEFEQVIPISELSIQKQDWVRSQHPEADTTVIEAVYSATESSYEAYYFKDNMLIDKIDFNQ